MTQNPFINALSASAYIGAIVLFLSNAERIFGNVEDMALIPFGMLSLFVLSAAVMGYIFCYEPIKMFLEDKKQEGVNLFLKTVGIFAVITLLIFTILIFVSRM
jgi:hypothetical protein